MIAQYNTDPVDYLPVYPNLFSNLDTQTTHWVSQLITADALAQAYHTQTGVGSPDGLSTLCLFTTDETLLQAAALGARRWVDDENARRGGRDNVTILVDATQTD